MSSRQRLKLTQAVIVEGKYDQIRLHSILDALIIPTDGFRIYKNTEQLELIRRLAKTVGIVLLTDSDAAGFQIRNYIAGAIQEGTVYHVYAPDVFGKESRKPRPSKEGKLGVEGLDGAVLLRAFERAGIPSVSGNASPANSGITGLDLYLLGLSGTAGSAILRRRLLELLGLPARLSTSAMLAVLNRTVTLELLQETVDALRRTELSEVPEQGEELEDT